MTIRDSLAPIEGDYSTFFIKTSLEILNKDQNALWRITLLDNGSIEVSAIGNVKQGKKLLGEPIKVLPDCSNSIIVERSEYQK